MDSLCRIGRVSRFRTPLSPLRQKFQDADEVVADQIEQEAGSKNLKINNMVVPTGFEPVFKP